MVKRQDKKESFDIVHVIVGVLVILGGVLFIFDKVGVGGVVVAVALLIETLKNWIK